MCTACSGGPSVSTCLQCQQTQMPVCDWLQSCITADGVLEVHCGAARATVRRHEPYVVHCGAARVTVQHG
jgi:response regulator of citrate/malate metabolism